jgi:NADP-dependent 3-hydroxy acid dehydrogenase YdfG
MKRVLVTGAAKGLGEAIAKRCAERGHYVVATDVDAERLTELESSQIRTAILDVRDLDAWEQLVSDLEAREEEIDVLINNAGVCLPGRCDRVSPHDDRLTVEVNLIGVMNGIRALLPRFLERGRGHVINVASMAAFAPAPDLAAYCATKHAVRAYTHSCALDHRHAPIDWTVVCPSAVETPMLAGMRKRRAGAVVFTETPMPARRVADAVLDAIESPRAEVLIPRARGSVLRLLGLFPGVLARGMDGAERRGREKLDR